MVNALLVGRFHAVTRGQAEWLQTLATAPVEQVLCVLTSADHGGTRRNPLDADTREAMLRPALERTGKPVRVVRVNDVPDSAAWVEHVLSRVEAATGLWPTPLDTQVYSANRDVRQLFEAKGFETVGGEVTGLTPQELVQRVVDGREWKAEASKETAELLSRPEVQARLRGVFSQKLVNDDGELGHARDFRSYGEQMDAALRQKLDDLVPWVKPGLIVDKGCGTGKLLVELSRLFPHSGFVGVDLSREFLRMCDENTYGSEDVSLVYGNIIERNVEPGSATTVIFSSVTHEIYSYTGYSLAELDRALATAALELQPGGHVLIRDGVSPGLAPVRLRLVDPQTREVFKRFAAEFKHGQGVKHAWEGKDEVRLSAHDANEFLCKKDYLKNWHIEMHEEYGAHTLAGYREALARAGLQPVEVRGYVNPWIAQHRYEGHVELLDDAGAKLPWFDTNLVAVGWQTFSRREKVTGGRVRGRHRVSSSQGRPQPPRGEVSTALSA